jgi:uncharacterized protein (DUF1800 family)
MNTPIILFRAHRVSFPAVVALLCSMLLLSQPVFGLLAVSQVRSSRNLQRKNANSSELTKDQSVAHVLSRLTFGARPGDFERVKAMGIEAFIAKQLDPDSIEETAVQAKVARLPTLGLAQPVLIEQYTPPKPKPEPSPTPVQLPPLNNPGVQADKKGEAAKTDDGKMVATPGSESVKAPEVMPKQGDSSQKPQSMPVPAAKPTPPPKNPQLVVTELQRAALLRAVYSERQLFEMMVGFWENHFSIYAYKDDDRYLMTSFDRDTIRPFAMGRFRDLLGATAHSPAMLYYLDNWRSSVARPYPATKDKPAGIDGGLNENYARELLELHTMGVDGGYTQQDVQEVARCFSGWTILKPNEQGLFLYRPGLHDKGEKVVLGHKISAGGLADGERVLDILARHPATAHFIATKLARRFISDDPPKAVIDRATAVFLKTDGSIRETLRAIITAPEFFSPTAYRAKIRSPFEYVAAALRALNAESDVDPAVPDWTKRMGQPLFGRVTPDGYADRAEQWLSAGAMLQRFNFAIALASNKIKGTHIDPASMYKDADLNRPQAVADRLTNALLAGDVSQQTRAAIERLATEESAKPVVAAPPLTGINYLGEPGKPPATAGNSTFVAQLITMLIGSPEFQRR